LKKEQSVIQKKKKFCKDVPGKRKQPLINLKGPKPFSCGRGQLVWREITTSPNSLGQSLKNPGEGGGIDESSKKSLRWTNRANGYCEEGRAGL